MIIFRVTAAILSGLLFSGLFVWIMNVIAHGVAMAGSLVP